MADSEGGAKRGWTVRLGIRLKPFLFAATAVLLGLGVAEGLAGLVLWVLGPPSWEELRLPEPGPPKSRSEVVRRVEMQALLEHGREPSQRVLLVPDPEMAWMVAPSDGSTVLADGRYRINELGLRGPPAPLAVEGMIRLFFLGDSSIFGFDLREGDTIGVVAAAELAAMLPGRAGAVVPHNGGVPGHAAAQSLALLRRHGEVLRPDWVVIANLWSDAYGHGGLTGDSWLFRLAGGTSIFRLWVRLLEPWLESRKVGWFDSPADFERAGEGMAERLEAYRGNLEQLVQESVRLGARPLFLLLPAPIDFGPSPLPEVVVRFRETMREVARELAVPLVEGPEVLRSARVGLGGFLDQVHPNGTGSYWLGKGVAEAIASELGPQEHQRPEH